MFVNLRGFGPDPTQPPADPAAVLDGFLRLLGVPGQQVPHSLAARSAAYRQRLAGTQALVVLDNAADAEQVRPRALRIARDIGHRFGELHALTGLGGVDRMLGRHERAAGCYQQVLGLAHAHRSLRQHDRNPRPASPASGRIFPASSGNCQCRTMRLP